MNFFSLHRKLLLWLWMATLVFLFAFSSKAAFLSGTLAPLPAGSITNLTVEGKLDWVHWGLRSDSSINRKSTVTPQISDFTLLNASSNFNETYAYQVTDGKAGFSWNDGRPVMEATNSTNGVWAYNFDAVGSGFELTVPADTTLKTLRLYIGVFNARGKLEASLSDGSAAAYVNTSAVSPPGGGGSNGVYTLNFAAASSNQTLLIRWSVAIPSGGTSPNVTLEAATLSASNTNNPPYTSLTSPAAYTNFPWLSQIPIEAKAADADGTVSKVEFFSDGTKLSESFGPAYTFSWSSAQVGLHTLTARVTDNLGGSSISSARDIFVYTNGGLLSGTVETPPAGVDLTAEGTRDWMHWGLLASNSIDRKIVLAQNINGLTTIGTNSIERFFDGATAFSWSDGTPTLNASSSTTGIFITGFENGFELTTPADSFERVLKLYVGVYGGQGNLFAYLSDGSAASYNDNSLSNDFETSHGLYTLNYVAGHSGQTLHVRFTTTGIFDMDFGNVAIASATLIGGPNPVQLLDPQLAHDGFSFSFQTDLTRTYAAQFCTSLNTTNWQTFTNLSGNGSMVRVTNESPDVVKCFYRVVAQP